MKLVRRNFFLSLLLSVLLIGFGTGREFVYCTHAAAAEPCDAVPTTCCDHRREAAPDCMRTVSGRFSPTDVAPTFRFDFHRPLSQAVGFFSFPVVFRWLPVPSNRRFFVPSPPEKPPRAYLRFIRLLLI